MDYGFVDQGILSSKLVQARTAPSFVIDNMMSRQSLIFTSACLTKKFPQSVTRTILVKDLGSTHTSGELGSTMNTAFLKTHCRSFGMAFLTLFRIATGNLDYLIKDTPSNGRLSEDYLSTSFT